MKTIIVAAVTCMASITTASAQTVDTTYDESVVKAKCSAQYGTEYDMVAYCMDTNKAGHSEFVNTVEHTKALRGIQQALASAEWGNEFDMVAYCMTTRIAAWRKIN